MKTPLEKAQLMSRWTALGHAKFCIAIMILGSVVALLMTLCNVFGLKLSTPVYYPTCIASCIVFSAWIARGIAVRRFAGVSVSEIKGLENHFNNGAEFNELLGEEQQAHLLRLAREQGFVAWRQVAKVARVQAVEWMFVARGAEPLATVDHWRAVCSEGAQLDAFSARVDRGSAPRRL